jgi:hypothetical protein
MMMTAFGTTYRCGVSESKLRSLGVSKSLRRMVTQSLPKEFIKNLINEVDYATDSVGPSNIGNSTV